MRRHRAGVVEVSHARYPFAATSITKRTHRGGQLERRAACELPHQHANPVAARVDLPRSFSSRSSVSPNCRVRWLPPASPARPRPRRRITRPPRAGPGSWRKAGIHELDAGRARPRSQARALPTLGYLVVPDAPFRAGPRAATSDVRHSRKSPGAFVVSTPWCDRVSDHQRCGSRGVVTPSVGSVGRRTPGKWRWRSGAIDPPAAQDGDAHKSQNAQNRRRDSSRTGFCD